MKGNGIWILISGLALGFVVGREVTVGVLDGRALGALEIVPRGEFYDYKSKYQKGQSEFQPRS